MVKWMPKSINRSCKRIWCLLLSLELPSDYIFWQDNDPKHTTKSMKKWLSENSVNVLEWPSQSPDLNPVGNLWQFLKVQIWKRALASASEDNIPGRMVQNTYWLLQEINWELLEEISGCWSEYSTKS